MGVSCVHSDRMDRGLLLELDVPSNVLLGNQFGGMARGRRGLIDYKNSAVWQITFLDIIRCRLPTKAWRFSGFQAVTNRR